MLRVNVRIIPVVLGSRVVGNVQGLRDEIIRVADSMFVIAILPDRPWVGLSKLKDKPPLMSCATRSIDSLGVTITWI